MRTLFKPADWCVIFLAALLCVLSIWQFWWLTWQRRYEPTSTVALLVRIHDRGHRQDWPLSVNRVVHIRGTDIEIAHHRVRVRKDPSPRQYCVKQGWLSQEGAVAVCAPSQIRVEILSKVQNIDYDHINF